MGIVMQERLQCGRTGFLGSDVEKENPVVHRSQSESVPLAHLRTTTPGQWEDEKVAACLPATTTRPADAICMTRPVPPGRSSGGAMRSFWTTATNRTQLHCVQGGRIERISFRYPADR